MDQIVHYNEVEETSCRETEDLLQQIPTSVLEQQPSTSLPEVVVQVDPASGETFVPNRAVAEPAQHARNQDAVVVEDAGPGPGVTSSLAPSVRRSPQLAPNQAELSAARGLPERRVPSTRVKRRPGYLRDYEE